jgi:hypothetical protein
MIPNLLVGVLKRTTTLNAMSRCMYTGNALFVSNWQNSRSLKIEFTVLRPTVSELLLKLRE